MLFIDLGLSSELCLNLSNLGYEEPTPVQEASIPKALAGTDLLVGAQTGTGKTAAFALPILENLLMGEGRPYPAPKKPIALVLTPTRELAHQVHESFRGYGAGLGLKSTVVFGGANMERQIQALRRGVHVLVATPGRLIDHMQQKKISLSSIEYLVLDEADRMLDMGFLPALKTIVEAIPAKRQTWLFSATFAPEIKKIASNFMVDADTVQISTENSIATTIRHRFHPVDPGKKRQMLVHMLAEKIDEQALVFCRTKNGCDRLTKYLRTGGFQADTIHGNKTQNARLAALKKFKAGQVNILVATDIAARGLDIQQLPTVINYDLPMVPSDYIHRIGRTGRAGVEGQAVSIVSTDQLDLFHAIQRILEQPAETGPLDGFAAGTTLDLSKPMSRRAKPNLIRRPSGGFGGGRKSDRNARPSQSRANAPSSERPKRRSVGSEPRRSHPGRNPAWGGARPDSRSGKPGFRGDSRSDSRPSYGQDSGSDSRSSYRRDSGSDSRSSHRRDSGSDSRSGYRRDSGSDSRSGYRRDSGSNSRSGTAPRYNRDDRPGTRSNFKPGYRGDSRPGSRPSYRGDSSPDSRPSYRGSRPDSRSDSRSNSKPGFRGDSRPGSRSNSKPGYRGDSSYNSRPSHGRTQRSDSKPGYRGESRSDSSPGYRGDSRSNSRPGRRDDSRSNSRPGYRGDSRADSNTGFRGNSRSDTRPSYRGDSRSSSKQAYRGDSRSDSRPSYQGDSRPGARFDSRRDRGRPDSRPRSREDGRRSEGHRFGKDGRTSERRPNSTRSPEGQFRQSVIREGGWDIPKVQRGTKGRKPRQAAFASQRKS